MSHPLHRQWRSMATVYWWHLRRGNLVRASDDFHRDFIESDRRLQAHDARLRYRHQRALAGTGR